MHAAQEIVHTKIGHQNGEETKRHVDMIGERTLEGAETLSMYHHRIDHKGDKRPHLFWVPTPIRTPRHIGPDGTYEDAEAQRGQSRIEKHPTERGQHVGLLLAFGVMKGIGARILDKFKQLYPDIEILLEDHIDSECEKLLLQDRVDVIVSIGRLTENNLQSCMLCSEQSYCIIHKDHPLYKKPFTVRDLLNYKILYMPSDFRGALPLEELEQKYGIHVKETFVSSQFDLLKNMAERNQGIFVIPECGMDPICPDVEYVPFPDPSYTWDVYATIKADNTNPSAKLFYDFCCRL